MALPTAATPGYGYYPTIGATPDVACNCLREWLPVFRRLLRYKGLGDVDIWQCTGDLGASGRTHSRGGAFDYSGISNSKAMIAREMGAYATWPRNWTGNRHTHGVLNGCPHNQPCAYQLAAMRIYRKNGLGYLGLAGPDPLPPPSRYRTWQEGIAWAKAQMSPTPAPTPTAPKGWDEMATKDEIKAALREVVKEPGTADVLFAGHRIIKDMRAADPNTAPRVTPSTAIERATLAHYVDRGTGSNALQEIADTRTQVAAIAAAVEKLAAAVARLEARP